MNENVKNVQKTKYQPISRVILIGKCNRLLSLVNRSDFFARIANGDILKKFNFSVYQAVPGNSPSCPGNSHSFTGSRTISPETPGKIWDKDIFGLGHFSDIWFRKIPSLPGIFQELATSRRCLVS